MSVTQNLIHHLILWYAPKITTHRFHALLRYFGSIENILNAPVSSLRTAHLLEETISYLKTPSIYQSQIEQDLEWQNKKGGAIITFNDIRYPPLLKEIKNPPLILFIKGIPEILSSPQIAIVGSRTPTPFGIEITQQFSNGLSETGLTITSGLALGIDTAAHQGALRKNGKTIAVLGSGIECIYPAQNKKLAEKIAEEGALISEFPIFTAPKKENFPQRNRIVSGLSLGVLVVEAGLKSGSLITAHLAVDQGREVFAIPGSIRNPQAQGCHYLIQQGAKLTSNIDDMLEELKGFDYVADKNKNPDQYHGTEQLNIYEQKLLACIGYESTPVDTIKQRSGWNIAQVNEVLCNLRFKNYIKSTLNGYIKIKG